MANFDCSNCGRDLAGEGYSVCAGCGEYVCNSCGNYVSGQGVLCPECTYDYWDSCNDDD